MAKLILDLCGGTGAWSKPYRDAGYKVGLITLPLYDVTKVDINDERITFLGQRGNRDVSVRLRRVHGILAAPPCTEFSLANKGQYGFGPDWAAGLVVVEACQRIIKACMLSGGLKWWAMENPVGHLRKFLGRPQYTFEHWWFDETAYTNKKTDLWGYFTNPIRTVHHAPLHTAADPNHNNNVPQWYTVPVPPEYAHLKLNRAARRAITPAGFAAAFAKANK